MSIETKKTEERLGGLLDTLDAASESLQKQVEALRVVINKAKGKPGDKGPPGDKGEKGDEGDKGKPGATS